MKVIRFFWRKMVFLLTHYDIDSMINLIFKIYFYLDNQIFTPYLHKNHASYGPISQARYDLYQILIYNALLVSHRQLI